MICDELDGSRLMHIWKKTALLFGGIAVVLIVYIGPSSYRKAQMDKEVDRLCAVDGGIRVYESVSLPSDQFNKWGDPKIPSSRNREAERALYNIHSEVRAVVKGDEHGRGQPTLNRFYSKVVRKADERVLGESISYGRSGGDPESPFHPSHYAGCTAAANSKDLLRAVFVKAK